MSTAVPGLSRPVVLIGPLAAGKSTVGAELARLLDVPICSIDDVRWTYFDQIGYDATEADRCFAGGRTPAEKMAYGKPFEVYAIEQVMAGQPLGVVDFGASNSVYDDPALLARVAAALSGSHVVLLLPSEDAATSAQVLEVRLRAILRAKGEQVGPDLLALNAYFVGHESNHQLANAIVYTADRPPSAIAAEVARGFDAAMRRSGA